MDLSLQAYAGVVAELAAGGAREEVLARHGLDEARWDAVDAHWQACLSEAMGEEIDGVPPLVAAYTSAYEAAQRSFTPPVSLEQFAQVTRLLQGAGDVQAVLAKVGVTLAGYMRGGEHWSRRMAEDQELARRFQDVLRGS
jgi:hypothetical protein